MARSDWFMHRRTATTRRQTKRSSTTSRQRKARQIESLEQRLLLAADVFTDQADYAPAQTAHIYASDFAIGEVVQFQVLHVDGTPNSGNGHSPWTVVDGSVDDLDGVVNGNIHTTWYVDPDDSADSTFELTAQGLTSGAMAATVFTDDGNDTPTNITTQPGWLDANGSNPVTVINAPAGFVITKVAIKSGNNSFAVPDPNNPDPGDDNTGDQHSGVITVDGTYGLGNGFTVSGLGTSIVTVTKNAGTKDISHVDYFLGTTPQGRIIVEKQTNPDGSVETFEFDPSYSANFLLSDGQQNNSGVLAPGSYTVQELAKLGWDLTNIQIVSGDTDNGSTIGGDADFDAGDNSATIDLDAGETITVRFTNTQRGRIIVEKQTNPDGNVETFEFDPSYSANFLLSDGQQNNSGVLAPGSYTVQELAKLGWKLTNIQIVSGDTDNGSTIGGDADFDAGDNTATIDLDAGETITVRFTNTKDRPVIVIGPDKGNKSAPIIKVVDKGTGEILSQFYVYEPSFMGGVRVATGDMTGDGIEEIIVAPGQGRSPEVRVFTQAGVELIQFRTLAYDVSHQGGVEVAVGDVNGDGKNDIVTTPTNARTLVRIFYNNYDSGIPLADPISNTPNVQFYDFDSKFKGGADVTVADVGTFLNGATVNAIMPDGKGEIIVGSGPSMRATVHVFDVTGAPTIVDTILPFNNKFKGGVTLSGARVNADAIPDLIIAAGNKGGSLVQVYSGLTNDSSDALLAAFATFADTSTKNMPVHATAIDTNGDGIADILAAVQGTNGKSNQIRCFELDGTFVGALAGFNGPWNIASLNDLDPHLPAGAANLVANDLLFSLLGDTYAKPKKKKK
jgi:hypothetical protein